ncbi:asparaginase [Proteiniphilum sp. UBA1028]|jgi:L-asparaginase|uniref:asparaginase n=1 Tax=Proteiniphilum sp. UBA1028 TaxID=1947251 RepID=UPI000E91D176|nr:type I asparaginase [Proteiniphilum sp. UBA1028]HBG57784.1 L-asparaginase 1 [Porphyromonadaceae bacterium]
MIDRNARVLLIYTGGTIGMMENMETGALEPFNFSHLRSNMPEIKRLNFSVETYLFDPPIDSSDMSLAVWQQIGRVIEMNYADYDGFVILHGTDTMAYTASALSFMFRNLTKPVILTGSQLPIGKLRTDGKENLITALEIAADKDADGHPVVPELSVYMQNLLMRGNRTTKVNADNFSAFTSPNYPFLAEVGLDIRYNRPMILQPDYNKPVQFNYAMDARVSILKLFPGITEDVVKAHVEIPGMKGMVLEAYGTGNGPVYPWFSKQIGRALERGILIVNVTQCLYGSVEMHRYENGRQLETMGVISGYDITTEAALAKLMILFGQGESREEVRRLMQLPLRGEMTLRR